MKFFNGDFQIVFIHNHKNQLGKFDAKAHDEYLFGYSLSLKLSESLIQRDNNKRKYFMLLLMGVRKPSSFQTLQLKK